MNHGYTCRHGLSLTEQCEACDKEIAQDILRRWGKPVDDAREVIEQEKKREEA